ncbi:MAG: DnaA regulatory inactivator Hda [Gammaproteobacteria bacterium]|nr:DnaA regulatory inactivator Hda [Gammaproteobacteria bacterium]MBU1646216.1 DnaA regulatory inactivator Hda [Gammaproteobacteria bacterium]MBU1972278.1 DnaA regulatory inactivator Hda [Gammaproteobacteria bacterium]
MTQMLLDLRPKQAPTLDNFVAGANAELMARLRGLASVGSFDAVFLWGPPGSGRSHLLAATARLADRQRAVTHLQADQVNAGGEEIPAPPGGLVVIEDVENLSDAAQIALFRLFNAARMVGLAILLSGEAAPAQLRLREDLRTRIGQGLIFEVKPLSDEEKSSALRRHALLRGMRMDDGLVNYLLRHGRRDLPSLMAVLDGLDRATLERKRHATLPLLREVMQLQLEKTEDETRPV